MMTRRIGATIGVAEPTALVPVVRRSFHAIALGAGLSLACAGGSQVDMAFDLSGLELFWEVADVLESERNPAAEQWDRLFEHPAYAQIQHSGQRQPVLREVIPLVFMPSRQAALDSMLTSTDPPRRGGLYRLVARHLMSVRNQRDELMAYAAELEESDMLDRGLETARGLLPDMDYGDVTPPTAFVILFEENGFGGANLALDLLLLRNRGAKLNSAYLGHEIHHAYLGRADPTRHPADEPDAFVVHSLSALHYEGLASMVDKPLLLDVNRRGELPESEREVAQRFTEFYLDSPKMLETIDSVLRGIATGALDADSSGRALRGMLPWGGHPNGLFMAQTIERAFGRNELVAIVDPFSFALRYDAAAEREGASRFSKATREYLTRLPGRLRPR